MQEITFNIDVRTILFVLVSWIVFGGILFVWNRIHNGKKPYNRESDNDDCNNQCILLLKKDFVYFGIIAGIVIVVLLTLTFTNNDDAVNYFSFAGTLSSIILSVVAIFMTINSENASKDAKSQLDRSISQMERTVADIKHFSNELNQTAETVQRQLKNTAEEIEEHLVNTANEIQARMDEVSNQNTEISNKMNHIVDQSYSYNDGDKEKWDEMPSKEGNTR